MKQRSRFVRLATQGAAVAGLLFAVQVTDATIYTLVPGGNLPAVSSTFPTGVGAPLASTTSPFNNGAIIGTLVSDVFSGDTSNPYAGGLTFTYQLSLNAGSPDSSSEMTVSSFNLFHTDVSYHTNNGFVNPSNFTRDGGGGDTVRFVFLNQAIGPGQSGALIIVQTDATAYHETQAGIIDALTVNVPSLAPLAVPEPGTFGWLLAGLGLLCLRNRWRKD
jgi:hypothetical protein